MRGRFTPGADDEEWCERRLLARIHRYTVKRLRAEIEPVAARDFLRFLFAWQRVTPTTRAWRARTRSPRSSAQLEGFEAPAGAWETEILPARLAGYEPAWLDDQCLAGRIAWARLRPRNATAERQRARARRRCARRRSRCWRAATRRSGRRSSPSAGRRSSPAPRAQAVADFIREHGASFFDELVDGTRPAAPAGRGGARRAGGARAWSAPTASAACARCWCRPTGASRSPAARRRRAPSMFGMEDAGRWALARRARAAPAAAQAEPEAVEHVARTLLRRYGVVFWRLLEREAGWLPPWRDLLRVYRRLEARGEIRGGRFVAGFSGEQFALPERSACCARSGASRRPAHWVSLSGADPLNLVGILTPGPKLAALTGNRVLYRDGLPVALLAGGEVQFLETLDAGAAMAGPQGAAARRRAGTARRSGLKLRLATRRSELARQLAPCRHNVAVGRQDLPATTQRVRQIKRLAAVSWFGS